MVFFPILKFEFFPNCILHYEFKKIRDTFSRHFSDLTKKAKWPEMAKITWIQPVPVMGSNFNQNDSRYCAWIVKMHTAHNFPAAWHSMYVTKTFCWAWYSQITHSQYNCLQNKNCAPSVSVNQSITVQVKVGQSQAKKGQTLPRELFAAEWIIRQAPSGTSSSRAIQEINWRRNSEKFSKENTTYY